MYKIDRRGGKGGKGINISDLKTDYAKLGFLFKSDLCILLQGNI